MMTCDNECHICMDNTESQNFKCHTCSNSICIECFKMIADNYFNNTQKKMLFKYNCPTCRNVKDYDYDAFNNEEIKNLSNFCYEDILQKLQDLNEINYKYVKTLEIKNETIAKFKEKEAIYTKLFEILNQCIQKVINKSNVVLTPCFQPYFDFYRANLIK